MKTAAVIVLCATLSTPYLFAREKSDVLIMNNGDRLSCEIKSLSAGVLYVSLEYISGTSPIDWSKVRRVESKQLFLVKTQNGSAYTGALTTMMTGGDRPVQIIVMDTSEAELAKKSEGNVADEKESKAARSPETNVVLEHQHVVTMYQTSNSFLQRFNGSVNSGWIYSKGNESTQFTFGTQVEYPSERWRAGGSYNSTLSESTGVAVATRNNGALYFRHLLSRRNWFYSGLGNFLQSSEQNVDLQSSLGGGIGRYLKNTNHAIIAVTGGLAWQNTKYTASSGLQGAQNVATMLVAADVRVFKFDKTNLAIRGAVLPAFSEPGRIFTNTNMTYYVKFLGNFTWNLSFYGNWDNQPPAHFSGSDYGASSGIGWTFGNP